MSITAEKVEEELLLPQQDRASLGHQHIASLDEVVDADAEAHWNEVVDRHSRKIEEGNVKCGPTEETRRDERAKFRVRCQPS